MEKWDVYSREGIRLDGFLIRGEKIPFGCYHLVCDVLVKHVDGSYLCMKRSMSKEGYPGFYEATGGGSALCGESKYDCVKRELLEETGIACDEFEEVNFFVAEESQSLFYSFVCNVDCDKNSIKLQESETEAFKWMTKKEFKEFVNSDRVITPQKNRYMNYFVREGLIE